MTSRDAICVYRRYEAVRHLIRDGDLVLKRGGGLIGRAGRSRYRHAGMASWWGGDLMLLEMVQWHGGRAVTLGSQIKRFDGLFDVFRAGPGGPRRWPRFDRVQAVRFMRRLTGQPYGWSTIFAISCLHLPGLWRLPWARRIARRGDRPDAVPGGQLADTYGPAICSEAVSAAYRAGGGFDPVVGLADRLTEPADLARSPFFAYQFTLVF